jgi:hypothetical protein
MDTVDERFRVNPAKPSQLVNNYIRKALASFNLPENRVFPLINYKNEPAKSFALDVLILRVLFNTLDCLVEAKVSKTFAEQIEIMKSAVGKITQVFKAENPIGEWLVHVELLVGLVSVEYDPAFECANEYYSARSRLASLQEQIRNGVAVTEQRDAVRREVIDSANKILGLRLDSGSIGHSIEELKSLDTLIDEQGEGEIVPLVDGIAEYRAWQVSHRDHTRESRWVAS